MKLIVGTKFELRINGRHYFGKIMHVDLKRKIVKVSWEHKLPYKLPSNYSLYTLECWIIYNIQYPSNVCNNKSSELIS